MRTVRRRDVLVLGLVPVAAAAASRRARADGKGPSVDLAAKALGVPTERKLPHDHAQAEVAKVTGRDVVCLCGTCPKRLITDCECGWAVQNQNAILNAVVQGRGRAEIVETYRRVYGTQVLAMLPNEGFATAAWALPYAAAVAGLVLAFVAGRRITRGHRASAEVRDDAAAPTAPAANDTDDREELARQLEDLD